MQKRQYYVYILINSTKTVLYIGITNNLLKRVWEHKQSIVKGFTQRYKVHYLIYFEAFDSPTIAITREKQLKSWSRFAKERLVDTRNPQRVDLYKDISA